MHEKGIISKLERALDHLYYSILTNEANVEKIRARLALETIFGDNFRQGLRSLTVRNTIYYDSLKEREVVCRWMFTPDDEHGQREETSQNDHDTLGDG